MTDLIIFGLICFSVGLVTGVVLVVSILVKAFTGFKRVMKPPKFGPD